jgi:hypothetical protein
VDTTLHAALDKYDIFAITVSLNYGKKILDFLEEDLANRQSVMDETGRSKISGKSDFTFTFHVAHVSPVFPCNRVSACSSAPGPASSSWLHTTAQFGRFLYTV